MTAVTEPGSHTDPDTAHPVETLLHLARRARHAQSAAELGFILSNETHGLCPYRQAALWLTHNGIHSLSGVISPEANAPFVHWLDRIASHLCATASDAPVLIQPDLLPPEDAAEWGEWLPAHAIWLPMPIPGNAAGLLLARDEAWQANEIFLLKEWCDIWQHAWRTWHTPAPQDKLLRLFQRPRLKPAHSPDALTPNPFNLRTWLREQPSQIKKSARALWRSPPKRYAALAALCLLIPVRMSILVPGELVPAHPASIRAPLDGSLDRFFIRPNQLVKAGEPLFQLDLTTLNGKLDVARQSLNTAEAEYRQTAQQAVFEARSKTLLASLQGHVAERQAELDFLQAQITRAQVLAPQDGIALVDDPSEWIGKPVITGERVMSIADEQDVEIEAWLSPADAIDLPEKASVRLYLNASPLTPASATLLYVAHEAILRPDASFAYRLRAALEPGEKHPRIGLKGTARVSGHYAPLIYWILRRPLATLRPWVGL